MKKIYGVLLATAMSISLTATDMTYDEINQMMVSYHNNIFGVDYLFDNEIPNEKLAAWLSVGQEVKKYTLAHCKDLFGTTDSNLTDAIETIEKANTMLIQSIKTAYHIKDSTPNLIKIAAVFQTLENQMKKTIEKLQNATFILRRKKRAQQLLINFALFIESTARKANKDTRMGHRTDIVIPTKPVQKLSTQEYIPLLPPSDMPPIYQEEEAPFAPPTRPAPQIPGN